MNATDIKTGSPKIDGRYVAFVRCQAVQAKDWVEPIIMTWHSSRWHTTYIANRQIIGWLGPIPVMKADDIEAKAPVEFDL
ncbi:MAG: hypothetical protein H0X34_07040 [Chthoniobacterales bacterium]|nr:hypothetical protein [Chthoniobacterales bacterium]